MPQPELTFPVYREHYLETLRTTGVSDQDAEAAIRFGWSISQAHQTCFGRSSTVPVSYCVTEVPLDHTVVASCNGRRFNKKPPGYVIYPVGLQRLIDAHFEGYRGQADRRIVDFALGVHEVRHHAQDVVPGLRLFDRKRLAGDWYDAQAAIVAFGMVAQFAEEERRLRTMGVPEHEIRWLLADVEFDAEIIERLFIHRAGQLSEPAAFAAFLTMDAPQL